MAGIIEIEIEIEKEFDVHIHEMHSEFGVFYAFDVVFHQEDGSANGKRMRYRDTWFASVPQLMAFARNWARERIS